MSEGLSPRTTTQAARDQVAVRALYAAADEGHRLELGLGRLEFIRTCEILKRYLPPPPARVYDVGGGPGAYLRWLLAEGYQPHLLDPVPHHVAEAQQTVAGAPGSASASQGNALALPFAGNSADAVLLLGPLYHLSERVDRLRALRQARRVLRPGGLLAVAAISRYSAFLDALDRRLLADEAFADIVERGLRTGRHRNPGRRHSSFISAFFHTPAMLSAEVAAAGFQVEAVLAVEGPAWVDRELDEDLQDDAFRERLLAFIRQIEAEPSLLGASPHILALATASRTTETS